MDEEWQKFETVLKKWDERIKQVTWHETGHAVYAIYNGIAVKGVRINWRNYCPVGGTTLFNADGREWWLMGDNMHLAGMAWQVRYNGETVESVVDEMMSTKGDGSDWEHLGKPSRDELIGMVNKCLEETADMCANDFVSKLSKAIHDRLLDKGKVTRKDLQAIGKETGWLIK